MKMIKYNGLKLTKEFLNEFWKEFGSKEKNGFGYKKEAKLQKLKDLASIKIDFKHRQPLSYRRERFLLGKRFKNVFKKPCFVCGESSNHRHHIIPLYQGGGNGKRNIVPLCIPCHKAIHHWL